MDRIIPAMNVCQVPRLPNTESFNHIYVADYKQFVTNKNLMRYYLVLVAVNIVVIVNHTPPRDLAFSRSALHFLDQRSSSRTLDFP